MSLGNDFSDGIALLFGFAWGLWWVIKGIVWLGNQIKTYTDERNQRVTKAKFDGSSVVQGKKPRGTFN